MTGGLCGECEPLAANPLLPPAEDGVVRRLRLPPVALVDNGATRHMKSRPIALDFRVLDVPVAIPVIEHLRVGEVDREVSYSLFIPSDSFVI